MNTATKLRVRREVKAKRPLPIVAPAVLGLSFLCLPLVALFQQAPWSRLASILVSDTVVEAARVSLFVSVGATVASVLLGTPLAWLLASLDGRLRTWARAIVLLPMVLPPVVGGVALLFALGRSGLVGQLLDNAWFSITLPFTMKGATVAATFVALPFFVITAETAMREQHERFAEAASALGSSPWNTFRKVTLPLSRPAMVAGASLAWARALGEFGATVTFAGNLAGKTQTLPLSTFLAIESGRPEEAIAASLLLLSLSVIVLARVGGRWLGR